MLPGFTVISRVYGECPEQTCLQVTACLLSPSWLSLTKTLLLLSDPCPFTPRDLDTADWMKLPSPETTPSSPFVFFSPPRLSPPARFCGSEFSRVRRLRKHNPQMSAGRLRYQKYPPGQLHSQGELKNWCKAAAPVWSESSRRSVPSCSFCGAHSHKSDLLTSLCLRRLSSVRSSCPAIPVLKRKPERFPHWWHISISVGGWLWLLLLSRVIESEMYNLLPAKSTERQWRSPNWLGQAAPLNSWNALYGETVLTFG